MTDITNPHDKFFKETFSHLDVAQDFLQHYLPPEIVKHLDLTTLAPCKETYVDHALQEQLTDLLYSVQLKSGQEAYIYLLFEHKSFPEPHIAFHLLRYRVKIWEHDRDSNSSSEFRIILPIVIYHGRAKWNVDLRFESLFPDLKEWFPFIPRFEYLLVDLSQLEEKQVVGILHLRICLLLLKSIFNTDLLEKVGAILELTRKLAQEKQSSDVLITVVQYILNGNTQVDHEDLVIEIKNALDEAGDEIMMTTAEYLVEKGKLNGVRNSIVKFLEARFGDVPSPINTMLEKIKREETLNQLLYSAATVNTLDNFIEHLSREVPHE